MEPQTRLLECRRESNLLKNTRGGVDIDVTSWFRVGIGTR